MTESTVSDGVAGRVRETRKRRRWQLIDLAVRCAKRGYPELTENVIENIEHGRRRGGRRTRDVTVDELLALAYALDVSPVYLICGLDFAAEVPVTPELERTAQEVWDWIQGVAPLAGMNADAYFQNLPVRIRPVRDPAAVLEFIDRTLDELGSLRKDAVISAEIYRELQERMRTREQQLMPGAGED